MQYLKNLYVKLMEWLDEIEQKQEQKKQQKKEEAYDIFINGWGMEIRCQDEQIRRFKRAVFLNEVSAHGYLDYYNLNTVFRSTKNKNQKYHTTLKNCSCPDFQERHLPCKHMYKLAYLLGIINETWDLSGVPSDVSSRIEALPPYSFKLFMNIISEHVKSNYPFRVKNNRNLTPVFESNLLIKMDFDYTVLYQYSKNDLIAAVATSGCDFKITSSTKKDELINYILNSDNKKLIKFKNSYINVHFPEDIVPITYYINREFNSNK